MRVIVNKFIPFPGFIAITIFNIIFWRKEYESRLNSYKGDIVKNHESIHEAQMRDFCNWIFVGGLIFYILYLLEWIFRLLFTKDAFSHNAYKHISFEQEAYKYEEDLNYLQIRKKFNEYNFI